MTNPPQIRPTHDAPAYRALTAGRDVADAATWLERVERENRVTRQQLEMAEQRARTDGLKEPARAALMDLVGFFQDTSDFSNASRHVTRVKDVSTGAAQHLEAAVRTLDVALDMRQYGGVATHVSRADHYVPSLAGANARRTAAAARNTALCAQGLLELERKKYRAAARSFAQVSRDAPMPGPVSVEDAATTAGLCALASYSRSELKELVLDDAGFRGLLELVPAVRDLLSALYEANYEALVASLRAAEPLLLLDPLFAGHAPAVLRDVRVQALVQFVLPYASVGIPSMARAFSETVPAMEAELAKLVGDGLIQARIDSHNKVLVARGDDQRDATLARAVEAGEAFVREARSLMFRASLLERDVVSDAARQGRARDGPKRERGGAKGGRGGAAAAAPAGPGDDVDDLVEEAWSDGSADDVELLRDVDMAER